MAKFYGDVWFIETKEVRPGVWKPEVTKRKYYGDVIRNSKRFEQGEKVNDNLTVNNEISILSDPYAIANFSGIRCVDWMGTLWKVNNVTVEYPRLILTIGGVYNGQKTESSCGTM